MKAWHWLLLGFFLGQAIASPSAAQIIPDGTTDTVINSTDNGTRIDAGDRAGDNLFHSFEEFSIPNGSEAFFNNPNDIVNIFSRVTGGNISNIDGLLKANGNANLFLINPAGIIFGKGAALNIGGSFVASTADSIVFQDNLEFSATDTDNAPLLTINQPLGLNLGSNPGDITIKNSSLEVNSGRTFGLFGGNLNISGGQIFAPGGRIELGSWGQSGRVIFNDSIAEDAIAFDPLTFTQEVAGADITLTDNADVSVQSLGGGSIGIHGRNLFMSGESSIAGGIAAESRSTQAQAGDLFLNVSNRIDIKQGSTISNRVEELASGNAGAIAIATGSLAVTERGTIDASTFGRGDAGAVSISANSISFTQDSYLFSRVDRAGVGNSGGVKINSGSLKIGEGGQINADTFGRGNGADIVINAQSIDISGFSDYNSGLYSDNNNNSGTAVGDAGNITIATDSLKVTSGGIIAANAQGLGNAGKVTITASDEVFLDNDGFILSRVSGDAGNSGGVTVTTNSLNLSNGGQINADTFSGGNGADIVIEAESIAISGIGGFPSGLYSNSNNDAGATTGNAGNIKIDTGSLEVTDGGTIDASTETSGDAGAIEITAADTVSFHNDSYAFSRVNGGASGNSGGITISTGSLNLTAGGQINADTYGSGNGADIIINARDEVNVSGFKGFASGLYANALRGSGDGGNISITTGNLTVDDDAVITVGNFFNQSVAGSAFQEFIFSPGTGAAGNLEIVADSVEVSGKGEITADNANGVGGQLRLATDFLILDNQATISASTTAESGRGGILSLNINELLLMRDRSLISARADRGADGGNIDLNAGFVFATPDGDSDIVASAARGSGGNINITTNSLLGFDQNASTPANTTNNIDASSRFGLDGTIAINELDINPAEVLEELPLEIIDVTSSVAQNLCQQGRESEFIVTGKGGMAANPLQVRDAEIEEVDLVQPANDSEDNTRIRVPSYAQTNPKPEIIEAQGWIINDRGNLELIAQKTDVNHHTVETENFPNICSTTTDAAHP